MKQRIAVNDPDEVHWSMEDDGHAVWVNTPCRLIWIERSERVASINDAKHVTVRFPNAVYVLHVFQKKSKRGIATPRHEMELVEKRLARVVELEKPSRKNLG